MIKALIGGDVWLAPPLNDKIEEIELSLEKITKDNIYDIFICNLEAPFKSSQIRTNRRALLYSKPYLLNAFNIADKNILLLANNHINDYGPKGLIKTIEGCKDKGFLIVGAGKNIEEARTPLLVEIRGKKIAIMSYAETTPYVGAIAATKDEPGVAPLEIDMILEDIADISEHVDDIWIFFHWGKEFIRYPMITQMGIARRIIDEGATMLIGHHPHVLVGYERIGEAYVYYSLGNFIFPDIPLQDKSTLIWRRISRSSMALTATFDDNTWEINRHYLLLNKDGIPEINFDKKAKNEFERISNVLVDPNYLNKYKYYLISDKIKSYAAKLINIKKLWKDILWRFRQIDLLKK